MSYSTWHNYGYGICVDDIREWDVGKLKELLNHAPKFHATVQGWLTEVGITEPTWDDYMEFDQDYLLGLATLLQKVIEEAEGIQMIACDDFNSVTYLLYSPSYPWQLKNSERDLTEEQIVQLFGRYVRSLTDVPIDVDYQSVENGG